MRLTRCCLQVGDGTSGTDRLTPVAVVGLGSGVTNVASGLVRLIFRGHVSESFVSLLCCGCGCGSFVRCFGLLWGACLRSGKFGEVHVVDCPLWLGRAVA